MFKFILLSLFLFGCLKPKTWKYEANQYEHNVAYNKKFTSSNVVITPFEDLRIRDNTDAKFLYLIPYAPFGYQDFSTPEKFPNHIETKNWTFNPTEDFAKALAYEIKGTDIFNESTFSTSTKDAQYLIRGQVLSTQYKGKRISYCLSGLGAMFWYIGLPSASISNHVSIKLELVDLKSENVIFTNIYSSPQITEYHNWSNASQTDFYYDKILKTLYKQFVEDIIRIKKQ